MNFFCKNTYSNLVQQKFLVFSKSLKSNVSFELKFENVDNLDDEVILKSFYFFLLVLGFSPSFKKFNFRYHLGKTFYNFNFFLNFKISFFDLFLINFFIRHLIEPNKVSFISKIFNNNLFLNLNDLKNLHLIESNPHFFKWEKDLFINCSINSLNLTKRLDFYFFSLQNFELYKFNNFWVNYVG